MKKMLKMPFSSVVSAVPALLFVAICGPAQAQTTPVGRWHSIDDKTGQAKAEIVISEQAGVLNGKVVKVLKKDANPDAKCDQCSDDRKDKPIVGLEIVRGAKKDAQDEVWTGGKILDPENGKEYTLKLTPQDGGKTLAVRGSIGPFGRTQTWKRVE